MSKIAAVDFANYVRVQKNNLKNQLINHNIEASDADSLETMVNKLQNFPSNPSLYTIQDDIPECPDLFSIIDNDPDIDEYSVVRLDIIPDYKLQEQFYVDANMIIKTSDGGRYTTAGQWHTHTWDLTKDIDTSYNFKIRWVMTICGSVNTTNIYQGSYPTVIARLYRNYNIVDNASQFKLISTFDIISTAGTPKIIYKFYDSCIINTSNATMPTGNGVINKARAVFVRNCSITKGNLGIILPVINADKVYDNTLPVVMQERMIDMQNTGTQLAIQSNFVCSKYSSGNYQTINGLIYTITNGNTLPQLNNISTSGYVYTGILEARSDQSHLPNNNQYFAGYCCSLKLAGEINRSFTLIKASSSTMVSRKTIIDVLNTLSDLTNETTQTITLPAGNEGQLTAEELAIATNKNWTISWS